MTNEELRELTLLALTAHPGTDDPFTGLGWTADRAYLRYEAGVIATAKNSTRHTYTKYNNGWAIIAYLYGIQDNGSWGGNWCGMLCISTDQAAAFMHDNAQSATQATYSYLGLPWYQCSNIQNRSYGGATVLSTQYPAFDASGWGRINISAPPPFSFFERIMQAAHVRKTTR